MPWRTTCAMDQRRQFIIAVLKAEKPFRHICADFGISEKTGYKWKQRFLEGGYGGLSDQSRRPKTSPNKLDEDTVIGIINLKHIYPAWGPKKILAKYKEKHKGDYPSLSSVTRVLDKVGLIEKRKIKKANPECPRMHQLTTPEKSNDVWAVDFKGYWKSGGEICEPLTIRDLRTRYPIGAELVTSKDAETIKEIFARKFREYGLPKAIRSDNGAPFASANGVLGLTTLSAWWITLGITPERSEKGCPGQNGSLERFHADIAAEIEGKIPGGIRANQMALDAWIEQYRNERPNEAIGMKTPAEVYVKSERKYTGDFDEIEYPIGFTPRKVKKNGTIKIDGVSVRIGSAFRGYHIGLKPLPKEGKYFAFLADFPLGYVDVETACFSPLNTIE